MAISTFLDPTQLPSRVQDQQTFDNFMALFMQLLPTWGNQVNATLGQINALLAGGAYALPYVFDSSTADADPGVGKLRLSSTTQNAATTLRMDTTAGGSDVSSMLDTFDASTSAVKGSFKIVKAADLSKFLTFDITARAAPNGYRNFTVTNTGGSSANPFTNGDAVLVFFQRNGDSGTPAGFPTLRVQHQSTPGQNGQNSVAGTAVRALNTVSRNTITGASLASNQVTLPAGTYKVTGSAPAFSAGGHQACLYSITGSVILLSGTAEYCNVNYPSQTRSLIEGEIILTGTTVLELRHSTNVATNGGLGLYSAGQISSGGVAVWGELLFEKVG